MEKREIIAMSGRELNRLELLQRVVSRRLTQAKAAELLSLSTRQVRRLMRAYESHGAVGLVSKKRGRRSNNRKSQEFKATVLGLLRRHYPDFGPSFANEKLSELHGIVVSTETLRSWMSEDGLWVPRRRRRSIHQPRHRRTCPGELVQIDGSPHAWLEDRGPVCTLLVFIDDATGRLMHLRLVASESTFDYMDATKSYIAEHGKPVALYSDKHGIFRNPDSRKHQGVVGQTQFARALAQLNIDIICANTPQAKGRVERANLTLQDRLVKELRLRDIATVQAANAYLAEFKAEYNKRFAVAPANPHDAHRSLLPNESLHEAMTWQETRKITKNLVVHYKLKSYHVTPTPGTVGMAGKHCDILEWENGEVALRYAGRDLPFTVFDKKPVVAQAAIVENKRLGAALAQIKLQQIERDRKRLASAKVTLRNKARIEAGMAV